MTGTIYNQVCGWCNITYGFKIDGELPTKYDTDYKVELTHGMCKECKPQVYKEYGLERLLQNGI